MRVTVIAELGTLSKDLGRGYGRVGNRRKTGNHPNYCIVKTNQNTEKSPGYMRRLAVAETPVKDHQLMLV